MSSYLWDGTELDALTENGRPLGLVFYNGDPDAICLAGHRILSAAWHSLADSLTRPSRWHFSYPNTCAHVQYAVYVNKVLEGATVFKAACRDPDNLNWL